MRFYNPHNANVAAVDLAQRCRGSGEIVMLMEERKLGENCYLKKNIIVGKWERGGAIGLDSVKMLHEIQGYMAKNAKGVVTGRVQLCGYHDTNEVIR
jgi:hypothetical protein